MRWLFVIFIILSQAVVAQPNNSDNQVISAHEMKTAIKNTVAALETTYLYPQKVQDAAQTLLNRSYSTSADRSDHLSQFRAELKKLLISSTHDTGIDVTDEESSSSAFTDPSNGIQTEITEGNIGYLKISGDFTAPDAANALLKTLSFMANVGALIIDLQSADKVNLSTVQLMIGYFVAADTVIGNITTNNGNKPLTVLPANNAKRFTDGLPVYVVNSAFVAEEWELLSFALQALNKATVVGEVTMGIGQLTKSIKVGNDIVLSLPYALIKHPLTNETWDQLGVSPDFQADSKSALNKAYQLALQQLTN